MSRIDPGLTRRSAMVALGAGAVVTVAPVAAAARAPGRGSLPEAVEALRVAMVAGDGKVLAALLHDHLNYMHSSGHSQTKQNVLTDLAGKKFFAAFDHAEQTVDVVGKIGVVKTTVDQVKNLPGGGTRASRIKVLHTWVQTGRGWQLLTRASALLSQAQTRQSSPQAAVPLATPTATAR